MATPQDVMGTTPKVLSAPVGYKVMTQSAYDALGNDVNEYMLYLVNSDIEDATVNNSSPYVCTDLYYGKNKLSDLMIVGSFTESEVMNFPNNKLYMTVVKKIDPVTQETYYNNLNLYLKYKNQVFPIANYSFKELTLENNFLKMVLKSDDPTTDNVPIYLPYLLDTSSGSANKFLNEQGQFIEIEGTSYIGSQFVTIDSVTHQISTTYYAGDNITIGNDGKISSTGGGGGGTSYTADNGIDITNNKIAVKLKQSDSGLAFDSNGGLYATAESVTYQQGNGITITADMTPTIAINLNVEGNVTKGLDFDSTSHGLKLKLKATGSCLDFDSNGGLYVDSSTLSFSLDDGIVG